MTVLRLDHFTIDPANTEELLTRHAALAATAKDAFPGLIEVQLAKVDDQTWIDVWRWDTLANARAAAAQGPTIPEAGAAFSLTKSLAVEYAEVVDA
jgi:hypothetical protein